MEAERIDFVGNVQCYALRVTMANLNLIRYSTGSQWSFSNKAEDEEEGI